MNSMFLLRFLPLPMACSLAFAGSEAGPEKIVMIGDSITQGAGYAVNGTTYSQNGNRSWRWAFFKHLVDAGADFDFVGSMTTNYTNNENGSDEDTNARYPSWRGVPFDRDHEGHWGWRSHQVRGTSVGPSSGKRGSGNLSEWLVEYTPDQAVIMIGINDLNDAGQTPATLATNVSALIDLLQADNPSVKIHLCELLHVGPNHGSYSPLNTKVDEYNSTQLPSLAASKTNDDSSVVIAPMLNPVKDGEIWSPIPGGWDPAAMTYDNVHPNSRGESHIAAKVALSFGLISQWTAVPVENGDFEEGFLQTGTVNCRPTGWTLFGTPNAGAVPQRRTDFSVIAESSADTGGDPGSSYIIAGPPDTGISQMLAESVQAGRQYQLQVSLYKGSVAAGPGDYSAEIRADGNTLGTISLIESLPMIVAGNSQLGGQLKEFTATFDADEFPNAIGSSLEIRLMAKNNTRYIGFEDVRLSWREMETVPEEEILKIFVLTGQSNSLGTLGTTDDTMRHVPLGSHPAEQDGGVLFYWDNRTDGTTNGDAALGDSGGWVKLGAQTGGVYAGNNDHWGPEIGFARMLWNAGHRDFAIVKASRGGGGNGFWQKGAADDHMYQHVVNTVNAATGSLPEPYGSHRVAGLLYVQGESNNTTEASAADVRFSELMDNLKSDLPRANSLVGVIGEIAGGGANRDTTRARHRSLALSRSDIAFAASAGLAVHNQDGLNVHYNAESQILLGERMAAAAIGLDVFVGKPLPAWENLHAWYISDSGAGLDGDGAVSRWAALHDGLATRDLTRRVSGKIYRRPVVAGNEETRNIMRFNGASNLWANATTEFGEISGARSVAFLCRIRGESNGYLFDGSTSNGRTRAQIRNVAWQAGVGAAWDQADPITAPLDAGIWQQHVFSYAPDGNGGTTVNHWIDGVLATTITDSGTANLGGLMLGSNGGSPFSHISADMAEVAIFNITLEEDDVISLKQSWDNRWGVPSAPPFAATVFQESREVARFGMHSLLGLEIESPPNGAVLEQVRIQLAPGTRGRVSRLALYSASEDGSYHPADVPLAVVQNPGTDEVLFSITAALLADETARFIVAVEPRRYAPLGAYIDASWIDLTLMGDSSVTITPNNADPDGQLTLGLVPLFSDMVRSGQDGINTFRIPGIVTDESGVLHAVYDHRYNNSGDLPGNIDVGYSRSDDGGATWSQTKVIMDYDASVPNSSGNGVGDPCILYDPFTDTIWVAALWSFGNRAYNGSGPGLLPSETGQYVLTKSSDGGTTWSDPINITSQIKDPAWRLLFCGPGHGLTLRDGTLVFPSQVRDASGTVQVCHVFSKDHGETWQFGSVIPQSSPQTNENEFLELDDGRLLFSMRTPSGSNGQRAWSHYTPGGDEPMQNGTWSSIYRLPAVPDPVCQASVIQWKSRLAGHPREWILFANPATGGRNGMTIRLSQDGGLTWPVSRLLYPGPSAYSSLTILNDGTIGLIFERDDYSKITFARVEQEWLMNSSQDQDNDGMPDAWEVLHGLNSNSADAHLDADGDGISNGDEYLAGTDPQNASSRFQVTGIEGSDDINLSWSSIPGKRYAIEQSEDLKGWESVMGFESITAFSESSSVNLPGNDVDVRFFRVRVLP